MKKWMIILAIVALPVLMAAEYTLRTDAFNWSSIGETTTAYTTPAVNERDYTNLAANHTDAIITTIDPFRWNEIVLRFVVDDDGDDTVFDLFVSKGQDYFTRIGTITIKGGTQVGPATSTSAATVFADTITITNEFWRKTLNVEDGAGGDRIATLWFDLAGFNTLALVGTTVDDTTLVQATGY